MSGNLSRPSQRSSSSSRSSSRRSTLSIAPGGGPLFRTSLSPQRALRARVLREKGNDPGVSGGSVDATGGGAAVGKAKGMVKTAPKAATRTQQMQFAFGSKVLKPNASKSGMSGVSGEVVRGRTGSSAAVDSGSALTRASRRERSVRQEAHEEQPRASSRGRRPAPATAAHARENPDAASNLKAQVDGREATTVNLQRRLEEERVEGERVAGSRTGRTGGSTQQQTEPEAKINGAQQEERQQHQLDELDAGAQAALRAVEEEARSDAHESLLKTQALAKETLSNTEEMQARVEEIIRILKARRQ